MGMYHTTYFAFGGKIADNAFEHMDLVEKFEPEGEFHAVLSSYDVGYLIAGDYDRDKLFLTTACESVDLGKYMRVSPDVHGVEADWTHNLQMVADEIGVELLENPAWFVVLDLS